MKKYLIIVTIGCLALFGLQLSSNKAAYAISVAHPSVHVSPHVSTTHTTVHTSPHIQTHTTPHTSPTVHTNNAGERVVKPAPRITTKSPIIKSTTKTASTLKGSNVHLSRNSISHMSEFQRRDIVNMSSYYSVYGRHPLSYYYNSNNYMFWCYAWVFNNTRQARDFREQNNIHDKKHKGMKWIKIENKLVWVPKKIYNHIKIGDRVELNGLKTIKINGKKYSV